MKKECLHIVRTVPGKVRLRFEKDRQQDPDLNQFLMIHGVTEVTFSRITKSLLLIYNTSMTTAEKLLEEIKKFPEIELRVSWEKGPTQKTNSLSHVIYTSTSEANRLTNNLFKKRADLTSIIPVALLIWSAEELIRNPVMPKWYDIFRAGESMLLGFKGAYSEE